MRAASRTHLRGISEHFLDVVDPADLESLERSMTAVARAGRSRVATDTASSASRSRRAAVGARSSDGDADGPLRGRLYAGRAASPTRAGRRGSTQPACSGVALLRHYAARLDRGRAEQHVLPVSRRPRRSTAGSPRRRPSSGSSVKAQRGGSFRSLQVDPVASVPWLTDPCGASASGSGRSSSGSPTASGATTTGSRRCWPRGRATCR